MLLALMKMEALVERLRTMKVACNFLVLCYKFKQVRGWNGDEDLGTNTFYYLYTEIYNRLISPTDWHIENPAYVSRIASDGNVGGSHVNIKGGVQFLELCYELRYGPRWYGQCKYYLLYIYWYNV